MEDPLPLPSAAHAWEIGVAVLMLASAAAVYVDATTLKPSPYDPLGPAAVPRVLAVVVAALSLVVLVRALAGGMRPRAARDGAIGFDRRPGLAAGVYALTAVYAALLHLTSLPYALVTATYVAAVGAAMVRGRRPALWRTLAIGAGVGTTLDVVFRRLLSVALP